MATQYKILVGDTDTPEIRVPTTGDDSYLAPVTLDAATGNEVAFDIQYTVNKATSGDDTGLVVNQTDTASPGTSLLADFQVNGVSRIGIRGDRLLINTAAGAVRAQFINNGEYYYGYDQSASTFIFPTITGSVCSFAYNGFASQTSGTNSLLKISPVYNQTSGTAANTDLLINRTEIAVGSGAQLLADFQVGGSSKFSVTNTGTIQLDGNTNHEIFAASNYTRIEAPIGVVLKQMADSADAVIHSFSPNTSGIEITASSGNQTYLEITPFVNQSGTAGYTALEIDVTETATGSGAQYLADFQVGGASKLSIDNTGTMDIDKTTADEGFINFKATADADATSAISTLTTSGATTHHIQIEINGTTAWIAASTTDPT